MFIWVIAYTILFKVIHGICYTVMYVTGIEGQSGKNSSTRKESLALVSYAHLLLV